jgi:hypothetical protein
MRRKNRNHRGEYTSTDYHAIKVLLSSVAGCWLLYWFGNNYDIKARDNFISPASDAIVIERVVPGMIEYKDREVARMPKNNEEIIRSVFGKDADVALKVAKCESGMNPKARNKTSTARGLFQVMASIHGVREKWLYDPLINTLIAKSLFDASGWNPWNSSASCWNK